MQVEPLTTKRKLEKKSIYPFPFPFLLLQSEAKDLLLKCLLSLFSCHHWINRSKPIMSSKQQTHHREWNIDCKVYIGNLSEGASKLDVENSFGKFGPLKNVWVARNPPGFAFVEYEDARDAEDAVRGLDGTKIAGARVRVEMSHGRQRRDRDGGGDRRGGGGRGFRGGGGGDYRNGGGRDYGRDVDRLVLFLIHS